MREFFRGWRRKVGCGVLVMALAVLGVWMRSYCRCDEIDIPSNGSVVYLNSVRSRLQWGRLTPSPAVTRLEWHSFNLAKMNAKDAWDNVDLDWRWDRVGFSFGAGRLKSQTPSVRVELWRLHYFVVVLPLTLLSAYLILWTPRKRTEVPPI